MSDRKRKISIRKIIQTLVTIIVVTGFTMAIVSADRLQNNKLVRGVAIRIRNRNTVQFLDEQEVRKMLFSDRHIDPKNLKLSALDIHKMEHIVRSNPWVSDAQIYVDNERNMHVYVTQRIPVVRVFDESNNSYYLDTALQSMPLSEQYVHYTPLVTGTPVLRDDSNSAAVKGKILSLVNYITAHKFWNAQIAQIVMTPERTFELIPVLGKQRIIIGDTSMLDTKLNNLLAFYLQVQNKVGWEKYEVIDLRYDGQVVASPALKWKVPYDKALSDMAWVKAVMDAGPKSGDKDEPMSNTDSTESPVQPVAANAFPQAIVAPKVPARQVKHSVPAAPIVKHMLKPAAHAPVHAMKNIKKPAHDKMPKKPAATNKKPLSNHPPKQ